MTLEPVEWPGAGGSYAVRLVQFPFRGEGLPSQAGQALSSRYRPGLRGITIG